MMDPMQQECHLSVDERSYPATALVRLINGRLGTTITADQLDQLFKTEWRKLSLLAHALHSNGAVNGR